MSFTPYALILAISLASCAADTPPEQSAPLFVSSEADRTAAIRSLTDCQILAAKRLDDLKSDAKTIGSAVASLCIRESETLFTVLTVGQSESRKRALRERWPADQLQFAVNTVLSLRSSSR